MGCMELAARVSEINLNDGGAIFFQPLGIGGLGVRQNIQGGRQSDFTLGLNWYPDKGIRFMANWVDVFQYSTNYNRPDLNGIHPAVVRTAGPGRLVRYAANKTPFPDFHPR